MGPFCSLPWGFTIFTVVVCLIECLVAAILWKTMYHDEEDSLSFDERPYFEFKND